MTTRHRLAGERFRTADPRVAVDWSGRCIDVGTGAFACLLVDNQTHNVLFARIRFSVGFVALLLARSELFSENPLVSLDHARGGHRQVTGISPVVDDPGKPGQGLDLQLAEDRRSRHPLRPPGHQLALIRPRVRRQRRDHVSDPNGAFDRQPRSSHRAPACCSAPSSPAGGVPLRTWLRVHALSVADLADDGVTGFSDHGGVRWPRPRVADETLFVSDAVAGDSAGRVTATPDWTTIAVAASNGAREVTSRDRLSTTTGPPQVPHCAQPGRNPRARVPNYPSAQQSLWVHAISASAAASFAAAAGGSVVVPTAADCTAHRTGDGEDSADNEDQNPDRPHHRNVCHESDNEKNDT